MKSKKHISEKKNIIREEDQNIVFEPLINIKSCVTGVVYLLNLSSMQITAFSFFTLRPLDIKDLVFVPINMTGRDRVLSLFDKFDLLN